MNDSQKGTSKVNIITYKLLLIQNNFKYSGFRYAHYVLPYICVCVCVCVCVLIQKTHILQNSYT